MPLLRHKQAKGEEIITEGFVCSCQVCPSLSKWTVIRAIFTNSLQKTAKLEGTARRHNLKQTSRVTGSGGGREGGGRRLERISGQDRKEEKEKEIYWTFLATFWWNLEIGKWFFESSRIAVRLNSNLFENKQLKMEKKCLFWPMLCKNNCVDAIFVKSEDWPFVLSPKA